MKNERILDVIGRVDEKYILEAAPGKQRKNRKFNWTKWGAWGAMAACACMVFYVGARMVFFVGFDAMSSEEAASAPANDSAFEYAESVKNESATTDGAMAESAAASSSAAAESSEYASTETAPEEVMEANWGITLSVENVTPTGLTLVCTQSGGEPTGELQTGSDFKLEALENGEWKDVPYVVDNLAWTAVAYLIPMEESTSWEIYWESIYGELEAGTYRISKEITDFRGTGDYDTEEFYVEFTIVEK